MKQLKAVNKLQKEVHGCFKKLIFCSSSEFKERKTIASSESNLQGIVRNKAPRSNIAGNKFFELEIPLSQAKVHQCSRTLLKIRLLPCHDNMSI